MPRQWFEVL